MFARAVLPEAAAAVEQALRKWALLDGDVCLLCVQLDIQDEDSVEPLSFLPWELLPEGLGLPTLVVARCLRVPPERTYAEDAAPVLGVAAAPTYRGVAAPSAGEAAALARRFCSSLSASILGTDAHHDLAARIQESKATLLHVATPAVRHANGDAHLLLDEGAAGGPWVSVMGLAGQLGVDPPVRLAVFSGPQTGPVAARLFVTATGAPSIGWLGHVDSAAVLGFHVALYDRLTDPMSAPRTLAEVIFELSKAVPPRRVGELPVLWLPSADPRIQRIPRGQGGCDPVRGGFESTSTHSRPVDVDLPSLLSPALHRRHAAAVKALVVHRSALPTLRDRDSLRVQVECDTGMGKSTFSTMIEAGAGARPVDARAFRFPALQDLVRQRVDRRDVTFTMRLIGDERVLFEETRSAVWLGYYEWIDDQHTWPYLPAYVQPQSDAVKDLIDQADRLLSSENGSTAALVGYLGGGDHSLTAQLRALFRALQEPPFALRYIAPGATVMALDGESPVSGQVVRLADEVRARGRGTCHDLCLLLAGAAEHLRIRPLLVLQEGHTLVGFWRTAEDQNEFWSSRSISGAFGDGWLIRRQEELRALDASGAVILVEATDVTKQHVSFEEACRRASAKLASGTFQVAIDVVLARLFVDSL